MLTTGVKTGHAAKFRELWRARLAPYAPVAQLVVQWTFNPWVVRSSRTGGTFRYLAIASMSQIDLC